MLVASKDKDEIKRLKAQLNKEFGMKDLGAAKKYLECKFKRQEDK